MKRINGFSRYAGGFTYLWVLLLVAFLGLGLTIAAEIDSVVRQREKERELLAVGRQFRLAIGRYYETQLSAGRREYPSTLDDLLLDKRFPGTRRHLRKIFLDPMTGKPEWGLLRVAGRIVGVHSLSAQVPIKQSGFEVENQSFTNKEKISSWVFSYPADILMTLDEKGLPIMPSTLQAQPLGSSALPVPLGSPPTQNNGIVK